MNHDDPSTVWTTRVAVLRRFAKTVKGGRRFSFGALVVVGNSSGCIGLGWGKSRDLGTALLKAERTAVAQQARVPLNGGRISHEVSGQYCGAKVLLWPASPGSGIVASKAVRDVLECAGVKDVVAKSLGARNPANVAKATLRALLSLRSKSRGASWPLVRLPAVIPGEDLLRLN